MILRFSFSLSRFHPSLAILADEEEASQGISRGYFSFWKWIRGRIDIEHSIRRRVDSVVKSGRCIRVIFFLVQPSCWCVFFSVFWVFQSFFFLGCWTGSPCGRSPTDRRLVAAKWPAGEPPSRFTFPPGPLPRVRLRLLRLLLLLLLLFDFNTRLFEENPPPRKKSKI